MAWYAIYEAQTKALRSIGESDVDPGPTLPAGLMALELPDQPDLSTHKWDVATATFIDRPQKPVDQDLADAAALIDKKMPWAPGDIETALRVLLKATLGGRNV